MTTADKVGEDDVLTRRATLIREGCCTPEQADQIIAQEQSQIKRRYRVTLTRFGEVTTKEFDDLNTAFWTAAGISGRLSTPGPFKVEMEEIKR